MSGNCPNPLLKSRCVVMVVDVEFKSQPCKTIHHTYNETLKGLRCSELPKSVQTHSILVRKVGKGKVNLTKPLIILMVKEWNGWYVVNCPNQSKLTQTWCKKWTRAKPTLTPPVTGKHVALTIIEHIYQSQPSSTIHYTYDETLEGLRCCETLESIQTYPILVWNEGSWSRNRHNPWLNSQGVEFVVDDEFKSRSCKTVHYTYGERMEGLRCCDLPKSVQTHSILVWKVDKGHANFDPTRDWKTSCGNLHRAHIPISTLQNHSLYLWWENGRVVMPWIDQISPKSLNLGVKSGDLELKSSPPVTQKPACSCSFSEWTPISALSCHS